jgi:hypothetical protein
MKMVEDKMNNSSDFTATIEEQLHQNNINSSTLDDLETITAQIAREILQDWLEKSEEIIAEPETRCRECGNYANYISKRVGFINTQFGLLRYKRAYYVCPHCHQSTCPLDERLNPDESLARLRAKVIAGKPLPVAELAKAWRLGSLGTVPEAQFHSVPSGQRQDQRSWATAIAGSI